METYVHHVVIYPKGWEQKLKVQLDVAFVKHITWNGIAWAHCADLVHEDTGQTPHF
jgi:hypothetical protein